MQFNLLLIEIWTSFIANDFEVIPKKPNFVVLYGITANFLLTFRIDFFPQNRGILSKTIYSNFRYSY
jgi:hypothetical protein